MGLLHATQHRVRIDLVLSYDTAVSFAQGQQDMRRMLDAMRLEGLEFEASPELGEAFLKCGPLKRIVRIR
jgi:hypothetical protein